MSTSVFPASSTSARSRNCGWRTTSVVVTSSGQLSVIGEQRGGQVAGSGHDGDRWDVGDPPAVSGARPVARGSSAPGQCSARRAGPDQDDVGVTAQRQQQISDRRRWTAGQPVRGRPYAIGQTGSCSPDPSGASRHKAAGEFVEPRPAATCSTTIIVFAFPQRHPAKRRVVRMPGSGSQWRAARLRQPATPRTPFATVWSRPGDPSTEVASASSSAPAMMIIELMNRLAMMFDPQYSSREARRAPDRSPVWR